MGVSGGADSVCLLAALHEMAKHHPFELHALHVNHLVRGEEAARDWEFVRELCAGMDVPATCREIDRVSRKPVGQTTEEYFREQRHARFVLRAREIDAPVIAIGHSSDDMSESLLMHLLRGAGLHGLTFSFSSMCGDRRIIRPLWKTPRETILRYLEQNDLAFREDATNASLEFTRNRIRHLLIPLLEREFNPSVGEALRHTAEILGDARLALREQAESLLRERFPEGLPQTLPVELIRPLRPIVQLEVLDVWLKHASRIETNPGYRVLEELRRFALSSHRSRFHQPGFSVVRGGDALALVRKQDAEIACGGAGGTSDEIAFSEMARRYVAVNPLAVLARIAEPVTVPSATGAVEVVTIDGRTVRLEVSLAGEGELPIGSSPVPEHLQLPLSVRNRLPGDRVSENVRLKSVLINDKVPYFLRNLLVVVTDAGGRVLHVVGNERINARLRRRDAPSVEVRVVSGEKRSHRADEVG